ncbi:DUF6584 family protein [Micromonospora mirobrigensis]|uniref:Uncharacterized protein n=1 Tax=Micromonospora mirobrigensis TaxID=262898 RepID=A0A1C5A9X4_9ACTN|nr:DUF6584 family protein [Micromonospora mirobrigensis]SCF42043.1 hypothetical protein GA0070564_108186 [Micromonospora mirobrigensis]
MTDVLARARADLAAGRPWQARDRLRGALAHRQDHELLDLLATVHHEMRDLPAAGALWFVTGRDDPQARRAIEAWSARHRNDLARWHSIPAPVRRTVDSGPTQVLRRAVGPLDRPDRTDPDGQPESPWEPILFGGCAVTVVVWFVAMVGIGMWTVLRWIWG